MKQSVQRIVQTRTLSVLSHNAVRALAIAPRLCLRAMSSVGPRVSLHNSLFPQQPRVQTRSFSSASAAAAPVNGIIHFRLADIGEGIAECEVMKWFVNVGDHVKEFDKVCLVQSDKATVEITSRYAGRIAAVHYKVGEMAKVGQPLIDIAVDGATAATTSTPASAHTPPAQQTPTPSAASLAPAQPTPASPVAAPSMPAAPSAPSHTVAMGADSKPLASPAVRRIAKENNVNLSAVKPTGPNGRILKEDVQRYLSGGQQTQPQPQAAAPTRPTPQAPSAAQPQPQAQAAVLESDRVVPITGLARIMVQSMNASNAVPQFGFADEINMDAIMSQYALMKTLAAQRGVKKLSVFAFVVKAASLALKQYPILNSHVNKDCTQITYRASHNIGIAMDTPRGLLVPNIKSVNTKSVFEVASELARLQALGKEGMLAQADLKDGTFSLSNVGVLGGMGGSPLLVVPEVIIGALSKIMVMPRYHPISSSPLSSSSSSITDPSQLQLKPTQIMNISWSADHRVIDGATVARFSNVFKNYLENPTLMMMEMK